MIIFLTMAWYAVHKPLEVIRCQQLTSEIVLADGICVPTALGTERTKCAEVHINIIGQLYIGESAVWAWHT